tara:strand:+ start:33 stop:458 length:426 start_codon:yes stop_codon:yes gene_type:complete
MIKKIKFLFALLIIINLTDSLNAENNYFEQGKKLYENNNLKKAKIKFEKEIVFNPKSEVSYLYLAKIFKKEKKENLEKNNLETVLVLNPKNEEAIYQLALFNINKSNFSRARELIEDIKLVCINMCAKEQDLKEKLENSLK